ncbi:MAG TPA: hypothetical protein VLH40_05405, partial [Atribacteraceae bacterium]|nr:hypothetical protein [Atribacteraceae bacterium]
GRLMQYDTPQQVYLHPKNLFTAQYVGDPAMNFVEGSVSTLEGITRIECPFFSTQYNTHIPGLNGHLQKKVLFGIRPEELTIQQPNGDSVSFQAKIYAVEGYGDYFLVSLTIKDLIWKMVIVGDIGTVDLHSNEWITIYFSKNRMHFIDPSTEEVLL